MQSPFAIFRKNQKAGMVFLTLMAMIAFVFLDSVGRRGGGGGGRSSEVVVKLNTGSIDQFTMQQMVGRRHRANSFVYQALLAARGPQGAPQTAFGAPTRESIVTGYLLRLEAKRIGAVVTDEAIEDFIDEITQKKLSTDQFNEIRRSMRIDAKGLYDCLREQLLTNLVAKMESPRDPQSPEESWEFFRQLKVEQSIEVAGVPVKEFVAQIAAPSDSDAKRYFESHKESFPDSGSGFKPGFRQPRRVKLQVLEASYEAAEKRVPEVTDAEVQEYYEKNKDQLYVNRLPDASDAGKAGSESSPLEPEFSPEFDPDSTTPKDPDGKSPETPATEEKPAGETKKKDAEKPATEKPATEKPAAEKKDAGKPVPKDGKSSLPGKLPAANLASRILLRDLTETQRSGSAEAQVGGGELALLEDAPAREEAKPGDVKPVDAKVKEPAAGAAKDEKSAPVKKEDVPAKSDAEAKPADPAKPKPEASTKTGDDEDTKKETPETDPAKPEIDAEKTPAAEPAVFEKYRPLDDNLKEQIKETLLRERTMTELREKLGNEIASKLSDLGLKFNAPISADGNNLYVDLNSNGKRDADEPTIKTAKKVTGETATAEQKQELNEQLVKLSETELKQLSAKMDLDYYQTPLVSQEELSELPGIGSAMDMADPRHPSTVVEQVFSDENLYRPLQSLDLRTQNLYIYWKVGDIAAHVPKFEDPGVKDQVIATWKKEKAEALAQKRAEELAKLINQQVDKGPTAMEAALKGLTVAGDKEGLPLSSQVTPKFTWMREPPMNPSNPFMPSGPPQISSVFYVERAGKEFMQAVFDRLQPGDAGVAVNSDHSIYYVVKVVERSPTAPEEIEKLRDEFFALAGSGRPQPYQYLAQLKQQEMQSNWIKQLEKKYELKWIVTTDDSRLEASDMD